MVEIIKANETHLLQLAKLFNAYRLFYNQVSDIKAATIFLEERILKNESVIYAALWDNNFVGFVQLYPIFSSVGLSKALLLNDLYVHENARGKGVATALLQSAKQYGLDINAKWLLLQTSVDNFSAQKLYIKNNWKKVNDIFYELPLR